MGGNRREDRFRNLDDICNDLSSSNHIRWNRNKRHSQGWDLVLIETSQADTRSFTKSQSLPVNTMARIFISRGLQKIIGKCLIRL